MKIAALVKIKHGEMWKALETLGWSQAELARQADMDQSKIGEIINLKRRPTQGEVKKIEMAFLDAGTIVDVLSEWPEMFTAKVRSITYYQEIESDRLLSGGQSLQLENKEILQLLFDKLDLIEIDILLMNRVEGHPMRKIAEKYDLTHSRVQQISQDLNKKIYEFNEKLDLDGTLSKEGLTIYLGEGLSLVEEDEGPGFKFVETENPKAFSGKFPALAKAWEKV